MSNRPKGFKRMPIFYITGYSHSHGGLNIKGFDERLYNDEYYQSLIRPIHAKNKGRLKAKKIFDRLKILTCKYPFRW